MRTAFPLFSEARQVLSRRSLLGAAALGLVLPAAAQGSFPSKPLKQESMSIQKNHLR